MYRYGPYHKPFGVEKAGTGIEREDFRVGWGQKLDLGGVHFADSKNSVVIFMAVCRRECDFVTHGKPSDGSQNISRIVSVNDDIAAAAWNLRTADVVGRVGSDDPSSVSLAGLDNG